MCGAIYEWLDVAWIFYLDPYPIFHPSTMFLICHQSLCIFDGPSLALLRLVHVICLVFDIGYIRVVKTFRLTLFIIVFHYTHYIFPPQIGRIHHSISFCQIVKRYVRIGIIRSFANISSHLMVCFIFLVVCYIAIRFICRKLIGFPSNLIRIYFPYYPPFWNLRSSDSFQMTQFFELLIYLSNSHLILSYCAQYLKFVW